MSADETAAATPLDLDAVERDYQTPALRNNVPTSVVLALVAEVRRLRAQVEQVEALAVAWDEVPDYRRTSYDLGRVDQRHDLALELLTLLAATPPRT